MSRHEHASGAESQQDSSATGQYDGQQPQQSGATTAQRGSAGSSVPTGFRLISLTFAGVGLALLAGGAIVILGANAVSAFLGPVGSALAVVGLFVGALGVSHLAVGYGIWTFKPWAHRVGLFIAIGSGLGSATFLLMGSPVGLAGLAAHGAIAWYLHANRQQYAQLRQTA